MRTRPCTFWLHFFFLNEWLILETAKFCVYVVWKCCSTQHSTMGYIYKFIETHIFIFILFISNPIFISLSCSCLSKMQKLRFDVFEFRLILHKRKNSTYTRWNSAFIVIAHISWLSFINVYYLYIYYSSDIDNSTIHQCLYVSFVLYLM